MNSSFCSSTYLYFSRRLKNRLLALYLEPVLLPGFAGKPGLSAAVDVEHLVKSQSGCDLVEMLHKNNSCSESVPMIVLLSSWIESNFTDNMNLWWDSECSRHERAGQCDTAMMLWCWPTCDVDIYVEREGEMFYPTFCVCSAGWVRGPATSVSVTTLSCLS